MSNTFGLPDHMAQRGSCIACLNGTDTALGFRGDLEWAAAGLTALGVPEDQAVATVENTELPVDEAGRVEAVFQVCASCAAKAGMPVGLVYGGAKIPTIEAVAK